MNTSLITVERLSRVSAGASLLAVWVVGVVVMILMSASRVFTAYQAVIHNQADLWFEVSLAAYCVFLSSVLVLVIAKSWEQFKNFILSIFSRAP